MFRFLMELMSKRIFNLTFFSRGGPYDAPLNQVLQVSHGASGG
jgi:hypothetical protein